MTTATLSSKFQILIPKEVRETMGFEPGQKFDFVVHGGSLKIVPQRSMRGLFGMAAGAKPFERDRADLKRESSASNKAKRVPKK